MFSFFKRTPSQLEEENQKASAPLLTTESKTPPTLNNGVTFEQPGARLEDILSVIAGTDKKRLRLVLNELVKKAPDTTIPVILEHLFVVQPTEGEAENAVSAVSNGVNGRLSEESDGPAKKRKRSNTKGDAEKPAIQEESRPTKAVRRYEVCENCEIEYDVTRNSSTACKYHTEPKEVYDDDDFWADDDPEIFGYPESHIDDTSGDYDEGFQYPCCGENGGSKGCKTSAHSKKQTWV